MAQGSLLRGALPPSMTEALQIRPVRSPGPMVTLCGVDTTRPRKPTLDTVAGVVGVSRATVSNAYNRPDQLSAALRERILAAALELGYAGPDPVARSLATRSSA